MGRGVGRGERQRDIERRVRETEGDRDIQRGRKKERERKIRRKRCGERETERQGYRSGVQVAPPIMEERTFRSPI